ncbi:MAG: hypothetical protein VX733_00350 [Candidatus Latescibacterota bacterium]|nr:hypothetical protein [Candidatus Latescibacterota bacterium]
MIWLIPLWKTLVPFVVWVTMMGCLMRFWDVRECSAACFSMLLLVATTMLHGSSQFVLLRFPHPGDGLWLAILWVSFVLNAERIERAYALWVCLIALATLTITPYYAILGGWLLVSQITWCLFTGQRSLAKRHATPLLVVGGLCGARLIQVMLSADSSRYLQHVLNLELEDTGEPDVGALILLAVAILAVGSAAGWRRKNLTPMDAAFLGILAIEPLTANTRFILGNDHQIGLHRHYHLIFEFAVAIGWCKEKLPKAAAHFKGTVWIWVIPLGLAALATLIVSDSSTNWLRYLPRSVPTHYEMDNDTLIFGVMPVLLLIVWLGIVCIGVRQWAGRPRRLVPLVTGITLLAYVAMPSQLEARTRDYPFGGAIDWLACNAESGDVVLTLPGKWTQIDYSILYAPVKAFYNFVGSHLSNQPTTDNFRQSYYVALQDGALDMAAYGDMKGVLARELSSHLRLNYVMLERSDALERRVADQIGDFSQEAYSDERSLLLRIFYE